MRKVRAAWSNFEVLIRGLSFDNVPLDEVEIADRLGYIDLDNLHQDIRRILEKASQ